MSGGARTTPEAFELRRRIGAWARDDLRREIEADFPLLRLLDSHDARFLLRELSSRAPGEGELLGLALVKRCWGDATGSTVLDAEERRIVDAALDRARDFEAGVRRAPPAKLARRALASAIREAFREDGGEYDADHSHWPSLPVFRTLIGGWEVETRIDLGSRETKLSYHHFVLSSLGYAGPVSLLSIYGLTAETSWDDFGDEDVPRVVATLVRLCRHFIDQAPSLVAGLAPPPAS